MGDKRADRRRIPKQERARATEEAIVEAAARVFAEVGIEAATTNRIAKLAGVSVGSLYQYFPNKQALTTALYLRESDALKHTLTRLVGELGLDDVPALVRAFVRETVSVFEAKRPLYRVLFEEVPRVSGFEPTLAIDRIGIQQLRLLLELGRSRIAAPDLDLAAKLVVRTYRYNTLAILLEPLASDEEREVFVEELTAMICLYLFGERPPPNERSDF